MAADMTALAANYAAFYTTLVAKGVPPELARTLTRDSLWTTQLYVTILGLASMALYPPKPAPPVDTGKDVADAVIAMAKGRASEAA